MERERVSKTTWTLSCCDLDDSIVEKLKVRDLDRQMTQLRTSDQKYSYSYSYSNSICMRALL